MNSSVEKIVVKVLIFLLRKSKLKLERGPGRESVMYQSPRFITGIPEKTDTKPTLLGLRIR